MPVFADLWKSPADVGQQSVDWTPVLPPGAVISASSWAVDVTQGAPDGSLVITDAGFNGLVTAFTWSGGTRGLGTRAVNTITFGTPDGQTATLQRGLWVKVRGDL